MEQDSVTFPARERSTVSELPLKTLSWEEVNQRFGITEADIFNCEEDEFEEGERMETNLAYKFEDERPEETIHGRVVMMASPTLNHNIISGNLYRLFGNYLRGKSCMPFHDNTKVYLEKNERYIPDMMVVCDRSKLQRKGVYGAPDLVVEVLSPSTGRNDKGHKKDMYEKHGVREYWIINPREQSVEQYVLENGRFVLRDIYTRYTEEMLAELRDEDDEEEPAPVTEFHPALFEDMTVRLEDVFQDVLPGL